MQAENAVDRDEQDLKKSVHDFWDSKACGEEAYALGEELFERLENQARARRILEPGILAFAKIPSMVGKDVLEIGVGMGADHLEIAKCGPRSLAGIDLTHRAIDFTRARLKYYGLESELSVGDAEGLPFADNSFDIIFSYGVLHHSPDTAAAVREVLRVLRPSGVARIMVYHRYSLVGYMLWLRYAALRGRPFTGLSRIYAQYLESPGTKAFTAKEAKALFRGFSRVCIRVELGTGDLLRGEAGQRHRGPLLRIAKALYPRWFVQRVLSRHGLNLLIEAVK
jgi:ubiquinone/menaquinone biosynthesis C-methylase UbiE